MYGTHYVLAVLAVIALCATGCEDILEGLYANGVPADAVSFEATFSNESSATVSVSPAGIQTFEPFTLAPGEERVVAFEPESDRNFHVEHTYESSHPVVEQHGDSWDYVFIDPAG